MKSKSKFNNNKRIKRKRNTAYIQRHLTYPYSIKSTFILQYPDYTLQNMNINIIQTLQANQLYNGYASLYQMVKLRSVQVSLVPVTKNGSNPPSGYITFIPNESLSPQYAQLPTLPGTVRIKPYKITTVRYRQQGRNDDFGKWYNTQSNLELERMDSSVYLRFDQVFENDKGYYQGEITYNITFQRPYIDSSNKKETSQQILLGDYTKEKEEDDQLESHI